MKNEVEVKQAIRDAMDGKRAPVHLDFENNPETRDWSDEVLHERSCCVGELADEDVNVGNRRCRNHTSREAAREYTNMTMDLE